MMGEGEGQEAPVRLVPGPWSLVAAGCCCCQGLYDLESKRAGELARRGTNSASNQRGRPAAPLQIEVKGHLNANIMAWYCMGVDMGVK